jgi:hypothetical protein
VFRVAEEEIPEWVKLPLDLQHRFFQLAEEEAEKIIGIIRDIDSNLSILRAEVSPHIRSLPDQVKSSLIAAVDGSRSPKLSERLGVRYGVFTYGTVYLRGFERVGEKFEASVFRRRQAHSRDESRFFFPLLTTYCERKMALEALDKCDLLFIDGSFYSFVYLALDMKKRGLLEERKHIVDELFELTEKLRRSGKVLGVIKRSQTKALGGYLALTVGRNPFLTVIDKHILSLIMPERTFFEYRSLLSEHPTIVYTELARLALKGEVEDDPIKALKRAEDKAYEPFENLNLPKDGFVSMNRAHVKVYSGLPPCEIEYPPTVNLTDVLSESNLFNEATNLPIALDLVDNLVNVSSKFTEEFVSEIEGRVLETLAKNGENLESIKAFFSFLNPQKPF